MNKTTSRECPRCKKKNDIPDESEKFKCLHCGANLTKIDRPSLIEVANFTDDLDNHIHKRIFQDFLSPDFTQIAIDDEKRRAEFFENQFKVLRSLLKANKHLRSYRRDEVVELERLKKTNEESGTDSYVGSIESIELEAEYDAYLMQLKAALDSFAKVLNVLLGTSFAGWSKGTDATTREQLTGLKILNHLKNIGKPSLEIQSMISFLGANMDWATRIVKLRDQPVHHGKSVSSGIQFNPKLSATQKAKIVHGKDQFEDVTSFMERTLYDMTSFVRMITYLGINHILDKGGCKIGVDENDNFVMVFPDMSGKSPE
jgi:DNA-directed RNA polymerase subunit RPC12/RpoP